MTMLHPGSASRILERLDPTAHLDEPRGELSPARPMPHDDGVSGTAYSFAPDSAGIYDGKPWPFPVVGVGATASHAIISLHYGQPGREWSLTVMESPAHELRVTGVVPTTDEIVSVLSNISAPAWFVPLVKALFVVALKQEDLRAEAARHAAEAMRARKAASGMSMLAGQAS